jgi:polyphosphate kinase
MNAGPEREHAPEFFNRELSWLAFNARVLQEACDPSNPLLERVKFTTIVASNLDEFFMVRVAGLKEAVREGDSRRDPAGMTPAEQLSAISAAAHTMVDTLYATVMNTLLPSLATHGIRVLPLADLDPASHAAVRAYFRDEVLAALTPLAIDFARPFPMLSSLSLNLAFWLPTGPDAREHRLAVVQVPPLLPRLIRVAGATGCTFVWLEEVIRAEFQSLFPGQTLREGVAFRLARDSELELDDEGGQSYLDALEQELRKRRRGAVVRLELDSAATEGFGNWLAELVGVEPEDRYRVPGPIDLRALSVLTELPGFDDLRETPRPPVSVLHGNQAAEIFSVLDERDIVLHHLYESFDPVVALVEAAADDPDVLAIKQTLYRTSGDSPVVAALTRAADQGKPVTVVLELMARFDEQRNIRWARRLEEMGAHVIYGVRHYKVHAKICLIVRRGASGLRRYVHLGTGNYNDRTARLYTDLGLMTASPDIGVDASAFFSGLTGYSDPPRFRKLVMAPTMLRSRLLKLIERESRRAQAGQPAEIRAKMNSLVDTEIIRALYDASRSGVDIRLNVRGVCALRPGVPGLSDTISVVSVVGRYLEHARVFVFHNGGDEEVFLASADWMGRNLDRRVELMFPVESASAQRKVLDALAPMFMDNVKGRRLLPNGEWRVPARTPDTEPLEAQLFLHEQALRDNTEPSGVLFEPLGNR